jgi:hypothetical protein
VKNVVENAEPARTRTTNTNTPTLLSSLQAVFQQTAGVMIGKEQKLRQITGGFVLRA